MTAWTVLAVAYWLVAICTFGMLVRIILDDFRTWPMRFLVSNIALALAVFWPLSLAGLLLFFLCWAIAERELDA